MLLVWGAPRNQRWVVPVAAMLALPALWYGSLSMLLGVIPLTTPDGAAPRVGRGSSRCSGGGRRRLDRPPEAAALLDAGTAPAPLRGREDRGERVRERVRGWRP